MAEAVERPPRRAVAQFRLVAESKERLLAPRCLPGTRDREHLVWREIRVFKLTWRFGESAIMTNVATKLGQGNEDLA